jgi:hypothetical protein
MPLSISAERLYDFEATLRLVDTALEELQIRAVDLKGDEHRSAPMGSRRREPAEQSTSLRVFREVQEGLHSLRHGRAVLERTSEPSRSQGPVSTGEALTGLDRALNLVTGLEPVGTSGNQAFESVREEIRSAMECLRMRDVTEQQLVYAASILLELDERLVQLADMLDPYGTPEY